MPHVVLVVNRLPSLLNTSIGAARRLQAAGFQTTFVCTTNLVERLESEGMEVAPVHHDERFEQRASADPRPALGSPLAVASWVRRRRKLRAESLQSNELSEVITSLSPDLLLINAETHAAMITTRKLGIPTLATTNFFSVFRSPNLPPLSSTLASPTSTADRVTIAIAWWRIRLGTAFWRLENRFGRGGLAAAVSPVRSDTVNSTDLRHLAKAAGVELRSRTDRSQWLRPHIYTDVPLISFTAKEMELPHHPNDQMTYVGPMVGQQRAEPGLPPKADATWQRLKARRRAAQPSNATDGSNQDARPIIYCSLGTVWSADTHFLQRVVEVFERRQDWNLVLSLGGADPSQLDLGTTPDNVLILDWAPQLEILANADCFITHGGVKSVSEAIHFKVPTVAYSTGFVDQNGNARRIEHHRLGIMADKDADSATDIEANVERALTDPTIADAITQMRSNFQSYEAAPVGDGEGEGELVKVVRRYLAIGSVTYG